MQLNDVLKLQEKTWTQKGNGVNAVINVVHKATQGQYGWKQPVNITDLTGTTTDITFETEYPESLFLLLKRHCSLHGNRRRITRYNRTKSNSYS